MDNHEKPYEAQSYLGKKYILKSKDIPLIVFELHRVDEKLENITNSYYRIENTKIFKENSALLPKGLPKDIDSKVLDSWIETRKIAHNRIFRDNILGVIEDERAKLRYIDVSFGLSLQDTFWIIPADSSIKWKDVSLYSHPFDSKLAEASFTGKPQEPVTKALSPELTTDGYLPKCWERRNSAIYLLKRDNPYSKLIFNQVSKEYFASQVADVMGFEHVDYELEYFKDYDGSQRVCCLCKCFTNEQYGFVNAYKFFKAKEVDFDKIDLCSIHEQLALADIYGNDKYADMMVLDCLICNSDRHMGNYGYIVNNDTGEFVRPAPIFDSGRAFEGKVGRFLDNDDKQAELFLQERHRGGLEKLLKFHAKRHPVVKFEKGTHAQVEKFVHGRAKRLLAILDNDTVALNNESMEENLPLYLKKDLDVFKNAKKGDSLIDCYYCELQSSINCAEEDREISSAVAWYLRETYLGITKA